MKLLQTIYESFLISIVHFVFLRYGIVIVVMNGGKRQCRLPRSCKRDGCVASLSSRIWSSIFFMKLAKSQTSFRLPMDALHDAKHYVQSERDGVTHGWQWNARRHANNNTVRTLVERLTQHQRLLIYNYSTVLHVQCTIQNRNKVGQINQNISKIEVESSQHCVGFDVSTHRCWADCVIRERRQHNHHHGSIRTCRSSYGA